MIAEVTAVNVWATDPEQFPDSIVVDQPFTVLSYEQSGEEVNEVGFESRNTQTTSTDVEQLKKELGQLRDAVDDWQDLEDEGKVGGGGGFLDDLGGGGSLGIIAIIAAAGALILGHNSDSGE